MDRPAPVTVTSAVRGHKVSISPPTEIPGVRREAAGTSLPASPPENEMDSNYGFGKPVQMSFADAVASVTRALQQEGFGVLTDIDVAATMKRKLDREMPPYRILGACNPVLAQRAIDAEPSIGLLLPCNVVVRQDDTDAVHVEFMDPKAVLDLVNNPGISAVASEVRKRLERVMASV